MKLFSSLLALIFFIFISVTYSQYNKAGKVMNIMEDGSNYPANTNIQPIPFIYDLVDPAGTIPNLTTFADYVTNGNNLRKLTVLGDTIIVTADYLDSLGALADRIIRYNVSYNGGLTWGTEVLNISTTDKHAYGDLSPILMTGSRTVAITGRQYASGSRAFASTDLILGLGVFNYLVNPAPGQDYFSMRISASQLGGGYRSGDTIRFTKYDYTNNTFGAPVTIATPPTETDANARYSYAASSDGQNMFMYWYVSTAGTERMDGRESTNGGTSFGSIFNILPTNYIALGDTVAAWFGMDAIYKPGTNVKCAAFCSNGVSDYGQRRQLKILFWSPAVNSGNPVVVADWHSATIPLMHDSLTFYNRACTTQVGMPYLGHPSIAFTDNGSRLICTFSAAQPDTIMYDPTTCFNYFDIFSAYSDDNGATWSTPVNLTNTPDIDEIYVSIAKTGNSPNNMGVVYQVSECPGSSTFNQTTLPRCPAYWVYRRYDPVTGNLISVKSISSEIPNSYNLRQNYPNPFNPSTVIRFDLPKSELVTLKVYDLLGREVKTLINNENVPAGANEIGFNASGLSSGVYFYTIEAGEYKATKKMMLVK